jgi:molybdopterin-guanine dinucleotide biosynthesis protein
MAIVVIGGHSRSVGKTSVVAELISALREYDWTAVKITQYGHGICSANGAPCDCVTADHSWAISEEKDRSGESDTSRFLLAGAARALWVRTEQGRLAEAMPVLRKRLDQARHVIVESNSVLKFLRPDLYLTVLDPSTEDFKTSAREFLDRAGAVILHENSNAHAAAWQAVSLKPVANRPIFRIAPPPYTTAEIVNFVRNSVPLATKADSSREARSE